MIVVKPVVALVDVHSPTSRKRLPARRGRRRGSRSVYVRVKRFRAQALERDLHAHALPGAHARRRIDAAHERLVGAAVHLQQDADAGHARRLAGVGIDRPPARQRDRSRRR